MVYYTQAGQAIEDAEMDNMRQAIEDAEMDNMRQATIAVVIRTMHINVVLECLEEAGLDRFDGPRIEGTVMTLRFSENDEFAVRQWLAGAFACGLIVSGGIER